MAVPVTELLCILVDDNFQHAVGGAYRVAVPSHRLILDLRKKIKEERQIDLAHVDAARLEVWKLHEPRGSSEIIQSFPNLHRSAGVLLEGDAEVARLVPAEAKILSHFSEPPEDKISVLVHISVPGGMFHDVNRECSIYLLTRAYRDWRTTLPDDAGPGLISDLMEKYAVVFIELNEWQKFQEIDIALNRIRRDEEDTHPTPDFVTKFEQMLDRKPGLCRDAVRLVNLAATYFDTREDSTVEVESHEDTQQPLRLADELEAVHIAHVVSHRWQKLWGPHKRALKERLAYGMFFSQLLCLPEDTTTKVNKYVLTYILGL
jgi:hypothetical protein